MSVRPSAVLRPRRPTGTVPNGPAPTPPSTAARPGPGRAGAGRLAVLDGLRLLAAVMVVAYHYVAFDRGARKPWGAGAVQTFPEIHLPASYGWLGVELFFLISGFVICLSAWGRGVGAFLRSRVVRLFPAYWAAVLLTCVVVRQWPGLRRPVGLSDALVNLTMLQEPIGVRPVDAVYWTLWVEARFYLLFAVLVWRGLTYQRVVAGCFGWLVAAAISTGAGLPVLTDLLQPAYAPYFVGGIAFFLIHRFGPHPTLYGLLGLSFLLAQHHVVGAVRHVSHDILQRPLPVGPAVVTITLMYAVLAAVAHGWWARVRWRWLTVAGALTYPLYLLHEYLGWLLIGGLRQHLPRYVTLAVVTTTMLLAAWLLHRLVERPLARILRGLLDRPPPAAAGAAAEVVVASPTPVGPQPLPEPAAVVPAGVGPAGPTGPG